MDSKNLLQAVFYTVVSIATFHILAVIFYLYWFIWWFDMPLHFLGGLCVGFFSMWISSLFLALKSKKNLKKILLSAIFGALFVGLLWELFEYVNGITYNTIGSYKLDTIKDLILDMFGGYVSYLYFEVKNKN